jgi:hypothetical protein
VAWIKYPTIPVDETYSFTARTAGAPFGAASADTAQTTENTANVFKKCLTDNYNECVVTAELGAHNDLRLARVDAPRMTHDAKASVKIQEMLNDKTAAYATKTPFPNLATTAGGAFASCHQSVATITGAYADGAGTAHWKTGRNTG